MTDPTADFVPRAETTSSFDTNAPAMGETERLPTVPGYQILGVLGRGGMSVVYKAQQHQPSRVVALKMILRGAHASTEERLRFLQEAEAVAALRHPNIVEIYEVGQLDGVPYFTLEYISGRSLADKTRNEPLSPTAAAEVMEPVVRAVAAAHAAGFAHRDLKPDNVLLTPDGTPKVTDFGLAKRLAMESGLTQTGAIFGTPSYMSPEQAQGFKDVGPAADVWGLGATLYKLITGRPPFLGATPIETCGLVLVSEPVTPSQLIVGMPKDLETICLKCLQKDVAKRYATATELADDLRRFLNGETILARPVGPVERLNKWVKRNPKIAAMLAIVFVTLTVATIVSSVFAMIAAERKREAEAAAIREGERADDARRAEERAKDLLGRSLFEQARQVRQSRQPGRSWRTLELLTELTTLGSRDSPGYPTREEIRAEAVAALTLSDIRSAGEWPVSFKYLRISGDGRVALVDTENTGARGEVPVRMLDTATGAELGRLPVGSSGLGYWNLDLGGGRVAVAEVSGERESRNAVRVIALPGGTVRHRLPWPKDPDRGLVVIPLDTSTRFFGDRLAAAKLDEDAVWLVLWDLANPDNPLRVHRFPHTRDIRALPHGVFFSPDGQRVAVGLADRRVAVVSADGTGEPTLVTLPHPDRATVWWWLPEKPWWLLRVPTPDGQAAPVVWDFEARREVLRLPSCDPAAWLGLGHDATRIVVGTPNGTARLYDAATGRELGETPVLHPRPLMLSRTLADGRVLTCSLDASAVRFWRPLEPATGMDTIAVPPGTTSVCFCADRPWIIAASPDAGLRRLTVIDAGTGHALQSWREAPPPTWPTRVDYPVPLAGGRVLTTNDLRVFEKSPKTGTIRNQRYTISDLTTGKPLAIRNSDEVTVPVLVASDELVERDGRVLYVEFYPLITDPAALVVWDLLSAREVARFTDPAAFAKGTEHAVTPDGRFVLVWPSDVAADRRCAVWDASTAKRVGELALGGATALRFRLSADGRWAGAWVREPGQPAAEFRVYALPTGEVKLCVPGREIGWAVFSPDGRHLAVAEHGGAVRVYELDTGRELVRWVRPDAEPVTLLLFTPSGGLAVLTATGPVRVLNLPAVQKELTARGLGW